MKLLSSMIRASLVRGSALLLLHLPARAQGLPAAEGRELARRVPADSVALFSIPDLGASIERVKTLPFGRILGDAEVKEFLARPLDLARKQFERVRSEAQKNAGLDPGVLLSTRWRAVELALTRARLDERGLELGLAARVDAGERWPEVRALLERVVEKAGKDPSVGRVEERTAGGRNWTLLRIPVPGVDGALFWTAEGTDVHVGVGSASGSGWGELFARVAEGKVAPSLAEDPDYLACAGRCGSAPAFRAFIRVRPLLDLLAAGVERGRGSVPTFLTGRSVQALAGALGLDGLRALSLASTAEKEHWENDLVLLAPAPRRGLLALGEGAAPDRELLKRVPADAASFSARSLPLASLWDTLLAASGSLGKEVEEPVRSGVARIEEARGVRIRQDLLGSLGESVVSYSMPSPALVAPGESAWLVRLRDPEKFEKAASSLAAALGEGVPFLQLKESENEGTKIRSFALKPGSGFAAPQGLPLNPLALLSPAFAVRGDLLVLSPNVQGLKRALARLRSEPGPGAESSAGYRRFADRVPEKARSISYADPRPTVETVYSAASSLLPLVASGADLPFDPSALPSVEALTGPLFGSVSYAEADAEAIHRRSFSSFGADGYLLVAGALPAAGAAISALTPTPRAAPPAPASAELLRGLEAHPLEHVRFLTDVDRETAERVGAQAEAAYATLSRLLGGEPKDLPLLLYGFATDAGYNRFAGSFGDDHSSVYGAYLATREASAPAVATLQVPQWAPLHLTHALAHPFLRRLAGPERAGALPAWLEEGIATYVERFADESLRSWSIEDLKRRGGPGSLSGFAAGFRLAADDPEGSQKRMLQAGLLVAYFLHGSDATELGAFRDALRALREGTRSELEQAAAALLRDEKGLEEKLRAFAGSPSR
ncbi:MAG TPA: hypothetical protein VFI25_01640 [Planctomycetota bacterium]|jgi:hypothetical protein|nr:hypothetical protein [Planctomycetota bacterium]